MPGGGVGGVRGEETGDGEPGGFGADPPCEVPKFLIMMADPGTIITEGFLSTAGFLNTAGFFMTFAGILYLATVRDLTTHARRLSEH